MVRLLRNVRKAFKLWRSLPETEQERYKGHVNRLRVLVAELGGKGAVGYAEAVGKEDTRDLPDEAVGARRPRPEIFAELQRETTSLLAALAPPTATFAKDSLPRSARVGGKLAGKGIRLAARRYSR